MDPRFCPLRLKNSLFAVFILKEKKIPFFPPFCQKRKIKILFIIILNLKEVKGKKKSINKRRHIIFAPPFSYSFLCFERESLFYNFFQVIYKMIYPKLIELNVNFSPI